jgi:sarcosine reductase
MELKRLYVDIEQVVFDDTSFVDGHTLHLCKEELEQVAADKAFSKVIIDIAAPGTDCRIMNIGDVVQPALKLDDEEATFPGVIGAMRVAGTGKTLMLRNVMVSEVLEIFVSIGCFLDMKGRGTEESDLSKYYHITIDAFPAEGVSNDDYLIAIHRASKKLAKHVAQIAKNCKIDEEEVFTLKRENLEGLPRVAYLCNAFCHAPLTDMTLYGESMQSAMPVILHPNEVLDGAITDRDYGQLINADPTCIWQNHPIILELYRRHGVDLNFVGVVLSNTPHTVEWKERNAAMAAAMIKYHLNAECCIITKEGGGHPQVDVAMAAEILEKDYGIKTVLVLAEFLSPNNGSYEQVLFTTKYADAMVSTGCVMPTEYPAVSRVIGNQTIWPYPGFTKGDVVPSESFIHRNRSVRGAMSQLGWSWHGSRKF